MNAYLEVKDLQAPLKIPKRLSDYNAGRFERWQQQSAGPRVSDVIHSHRSSTSKSNSKRPPWLNLFEEMGLRSDSWAVYHSHKLEQERLIHWSKCFKSSARGKRPRGGETRVQNEESVCQKGADMSIFHHLVWLRDNPGKRKLCNRTNQNNRLLLIKFSFSFIPICCICQSGLATSYIETTDGHTTASPML